MADGAAISGAASSSYTLAEGDVGKVVKVTVSFTDDAGNAETLTSAATAAVAAEDPPAADPPKFHVYYDPDGDAADQERLEEARDLLADVDTTHIETSGTATVDQLAGVTDSVLPRFFLGDPTGSGWESQPGTNNGGLRWLKRKLAELGL